MQASTCPPTTLPLVHKMAQHFISAATTSYPTKFFPPPSPTYEGFQNSCFHSLLCSDQGSPQCSVSGESTCAGELGADWPGVVIVEMREMTALQTMRHWPGRVNWLPETLGDSFISRNCLQLRNYYLGRNLLVQQFTWNFNIHFACMIVG